MNPFEQVNAYLRRLESRLRAAALSQGLAVAAATALGVTLLLAVVTNGFAFSDRSLGLARFVLFLSLALAVAFGLIAPAVRLNRLRAARRAERAMPELEQRLLTLAERGAKEPGDPFVELLAGDALEAVRQRGPERVVPARAISGFLGAAAASAGVLIWLIVAGPGYLGYGASRLWAGPTKPGVSPFYAINVSPGNRTVRRKADQLITATLAGFQAQKVRLFARYGGASRWEAVEMAPQQQGTGYEFLFAGIPESFDYYVEAAGVRSQQHKITVRDLPAVKNIRVTYRFPKWTGMADAVEDPGGDLRAVSGTEAELAVRTDRPLENGVLVLDDGTRLPLRNGVARIAIAKDGVYHVAAAERDELVRLTEDYFIEAREDAAPFVRIRRPGRDARANPIEEVVVEAEASDDYGLKDFALHYSVNGGPEKTVPLMKGPDNKQVEGRATLALEDFNLTPGDMVSLYASARDATREVKTDMYFVQAEPFERAYFQSQQSGGGGGGEGNESSEISQRQKEIIAAAWNELRAKNDPARAKENAHFLSDVQLKLRDQARSLAGRMRSRELSDTNLEFQKFSEEMQKSAEAMTETAEKLKEQKWQEALGPGQRSLQRLQRAEALFREIQVAFGGRGGGGGGGRGGMGRDLENLFDLELDTEKNQYETGQQLATNQRDRQMDEAFQKLEELARRQQELASRQNNQQQTPQQRWQQEILRREAEQLRRQIEQLSRANSSQGASASQQGGQQQSSQQQGGGSQGGQTPRQLQRALDELSRALDDMRQANAQSGSGSEARRAAERLRDAQRMLERAGQDRAQTQVDDLASRASRLNREQQDYVNELRKLYDPTRGEQARAGRQESQALAERRDKALAELERLERDLQDAARNLAGTQRGASSRLREALGGLQEEEIRQRIRYNSELVRRGLGAYSVMREAPVTQALQQLDDRLRDARAALDRDSQGRPGDQAETERALAEVERLRQELEAARQGARGQGQNQGQGQGQQRGGGDDRGGQNRNYGEGADRGGWYGGPAGWHYTAARLRSYLQNRPELARKIESASPSRLLAGLEEVELQLRRELNGGASEVRSGVSDTIPPGYDAAVAEYFRKLSKTPR